MLNKCFWLLTKHSKQAGMGFNSLLHYQLIVLLNNVHRQQNTHSPAYDGKHIPHARTRGTIGIG